jgi:putative exporter of polyketide antibiotics
MVPLFGGNNGLSPSSLFWLLVKLVTSTIVSISLVEREKRKKEKEIRRELIKTNVPNTRKRVLIDWNREGSGHLLVFIQEGIICAVVLLIRTRFELPV